MEPQHQNRRGLTDLSRHQSIALVASILCIKDLILPKDLENFDIEEIIYFMRERNGADNLQRDQWVVDVRGVCSVLLHAGRPYPYNVGGNARFSYSEIAEMVGYRRHTAALNAVQMYGEIFTMNRKRSLEGQFLGSPPTTHNP